MQTSRIKSGTGTLICGESKAVAKYRLTVVSGTPGARGTLHTDAKFAMDLAAECVMAGRLIAKGQDFDVTFTSGADIGTDGTLRVNVDGPVDDL